MRKIELKRSTRLFPLFAVVLISSSICGMGSARLQEGRRELRLFRAASDGAIARLETLLSQGADINGTDSEGETL
jgi:hypothetical protein